MANRNPLESRWQALLNVTLTPVVVRLPMAVRAERRDVAGRGALLCRIHSEFQEMPGLSLTPDQASKLFGLPLEVVSRILQRLSDAHVLRRRSDGQYALLVDES